MKNFILFYFILFLSCGNSKEEDFKIASIGKRIITKEEFENYLKIQLGPEPSRHIASVLSEMLDNYIIEEILFMEAKRLGIEGESKEVIISKLIEEVCSKIEKPKEEYIENWYKKNKDRFFVPQRYSFWKIFLTQRDLAQKVYNLAKKGEDFQKLAKEFSEGLDKEKGGLVGPLSLEDIPDEIASSILKLKKDEISPVLPVSGGFIIVKLKELLPAKELSFEEAKDIILSVLKEEMCQREKENLEKSLILKESIWIYQKNLVFSYSGQFPVYLQ